METVYGIKGWGSFLDPIYKNGVDYYNIRNKKLHVTHFKNGHPFLNLKPGLYTTSVDIYTYLYNKSDINESEYNSMLEKLREFEIVSKSTYKHYAENESDVNNYDIKLNCYWLTEREAKNFIKLMEER